MATVFSDDFTGANGAPWNAAKWELKGTPDIQGNTGRALRTHGARALMPDAADMELLVKVTKPVTPTFYAGHWLRGSNWGTGAAPADGYLLEVFSFSGNHSFKLARRVAGVQTDLAPGVSISAAATVWVRFRVQRSAIKGRVWADGSAEPTTWDLDLVDSNITGVGRHGLALFGPVADPDYDVRWDDLSVQDLTSGSPTVDSSTVLVDDPVVTVDGEPTGGAQTLAGALLTTTTSALPAIVSVGAQTVTANLLTVATEVLPALVPASPQSVTAGIISTSTSPLPASVLAPPTASVITTGAPTKASTPGTTASFIDLADPAIAEPLITASTVLQLTISCRGAQTPVDPSGWTLRAGPLRTGTSLGNVTETVYTRLGNPGALTVTFSSGTRGNASILPLFGVDRTTPMDSVPTTVVDSTADTNRDGPSITTVTPGALLVQCWSSEASAAGSFIPPTGMTSGVLADTDNRPHLVATETITTAGATGPRVATSPSSWLSVGIALAYRPAAASISFFASGLATSTGSAALQVRRRLSASGSLFPSGDMALILRPAGFSANGLAISSGSTALRAKRPLTAGGLAVTSGALRIGNRRPLSAAGLTQSTGVVLLIVRRRLGARGLGVSSGSLTFTSGAPIPIFEAPYVESLVPSGPGSLLSPIGGTEIRVSLGVVHPEGDLELTEVGVFGLEDVNSSDSGGGLTLDIVAMDRSARIRRDRFRSPYLVTGGTNAVGAIVALVRRSLPSTVFRVQPTEHTLPNLSWEFGDDPLEAVVQMRDSIGYETFFAGDGAYVIRSSAIEVDDPVWQFIEGPGTMVESLGRGLTREGVYNGVVQRGENRSSGLDPVQAEAWDTDPASPTYFDPAFPDRSSFGAVPLFHVCADDTTEILSRSGWKTHADLVEGDDVLTLDVATGVSVWQPVERVHRYSVVDQPMLSMEGRIHSSLTTMNHRWPVERYDQRRPASWVAMWATSAGLDRTMRLRCAAPCADLPTVPKWSDAFVELVAWYWTEGSDLKWRAATREDKRTGGVVIYQSHDKHPEYVARIRAALLAEVGPPTRMTAEDTEPRWREVKHATGPCAGMTNFRLNRHIGRLLQQVAPFKVVQPDFIASLTRAQLELFLSTSIDGDGHRSDIRGLELIQQGSEQLDPLQMAAVLLGYRPHLFPTPQKERVVSAGDQAKGFTGAASTDIWRMHLSRKSHMHLVSLFRHKTVETVDYTGTIWCPTTANGTWMARRRGTTYFTGNSEFIQTQTQAQDAADARVRNLRGLSEQVSITARSVPGLEGGDVVHIARQRINVDHAHIIERISLPLRAGKMSVRTRERRL